MGGEMPATTRRPAPGEHAAGAPVYSTDPRGFGTEYAQFSGVLGLTRAGMQWTAHADGLQKGPTLTLTPNLETRETRGRTTHFRLRPAAAHPAGAGCPLPDLICIFSDF
jgi:hypothetical protein